MDDELARAWRRGALALAVPGVCLLLLALACVRGAAARMWWDSRAAGVVTELNLTHNRGSCPTIEYAVGGKTYQVHTGGLYSADTFAVGQKVTVLYPPARPDLGMLDRFRELWSFPLFLSAVSLALVGLAWKARTGLPPVLHGICGFALTILGAMLGMTVFTLLCTPAGFNVFGGNPLVNFFAGMLLFLGLVPVSAIGAVVLWHRFVPARCPYCDGGVQGQFVGKRLVYHCATCGNLG